jgi:hypothetical protein
MNLLDPWRLRSRYSEVLQNGSRKRNSALGLCWPDAGVSSCFHKLFSTFRADQGILETNAPKKTQICAYFEKSMCRASLGSSLLIGTTDCLVIYLHCIVMLLSSLHRYIRHMVYLSSPIIDWLYLRLN